MVKKIELPLKINRKFFKREYIIWKAMKQRCHNKNHPRYKDYGKRGIIVCDEWRKSFEQFIWDMGACYAKHIGISYAALRSRFRQGFTLEEALTFKFKQKRLNMRQK